MNQIIHLHRGTVERHCCDGSCQRGDGICPQFQPTESSNETPKERHRFWTRMTCCIALVGFGATVLLHAGGYL